MEDFLAPSVTRIWAESGSNAALTVALLIGFNLGLILMIWLLSRSYRTGIAPTPGGGHFDRSKEPRWFWLVFGLNVLATVLIFVLAMITDVTLWLIWNGS